MRRTPASCSIAVSLPLLLLAASAAPAPTEAVQRLDEENPRSQGESFDRALDPDSRQDLPDEGTLDPEMVGLGAAVYAEGSCVFCHHYQGQGTSRGPDLTDPIWLHGDGSLASIRRVIWTGVPRHLQKGPSTPYEMRPQGGVSLDDAELDALSAFVWSLSHTHTTRLDTPAPSSR